MSWWELLGIPFLLSGFGAVILGFVVRKIYLTHNWIDNPHNKTHAKVVHTYPVPRGGGLVVFGSILVGVTFLIGFDKHIIGIMAGGLILTITGFLDDLLDIHPYYRLAAGVAAAACVVGSGIGIAYVTNPFGSGVIRLDQPQILLYFLGKWRSIWVLADLFAFIWIIWCMNMLNWSKGVDGQLPGIVVIAAIVIGILSMRFTGDVTQWPVVKLAALTSGAFFGLLMWNFYPQRLMPGYGAGSLSGYLLAVLSISSGAKLATLLLVLGVPMIDALVVMTRRIMTGKSPIWGDRTHLHHVLMDIGWGKRRIALFYWLITFILGVISLQLNPRQKAFTIVLIGLLVAGSGGILRWFITYSKRRDQDSGLKT